MALRERRNDDGDADGASPTGSAPGGALGPLRQAGEDFLAAGDEAISRALSGDSEKFLAATRQQGGE